MSTLINPLGGTLLPENNESTLLGSPYTGTAVTGIVNPKQIDNLSLWLDAADHSTIIEVGGAVSQWSDKSGNGSHAVQATGSRQPTTKSVTQNGLNVIDFDRSTTDNLVAPALTTGAETTIFVVFKETNVYPYTGGVDTLIQHVTASSGNYHVACANGFIDNTKPFLNIEGGGAGQVGRINGVVTNDISPSTWSLASSTTNAKPAHSGIVVIGAFTGNIFGHQGQIAEVIYYNKLLSDLEISVIDNYLLRKWGL